MDSDGASDSAQKRKANLFDAVAGRVASSGFIPQKQRASKNRDTLSSSRVAIPPEEVLFRPKAAPQRYEEDDFYWADRHLTASQRLPDSDLLKAIHAYAADFYARATPDGGLSDVYSLDETALLALGILMEEAAEQALGEAGDLVFVEGQEEDGDGGGDGGRARAGRSVRSTSSSATSLKSGETRRRKRRKVDAVNRRDSVP